MRKRIRTDDSILDTVNDPALCWTNGNTPPCPQAASVVEYTRSNHFQGMLDVNTPDFYKRSSAGEIINSPMAMEYVDRICRPGEYSYQGGNENGPMLYNGYCHITDVGIVPILRSVSASMADVTAYLSGFESERDVAITQAWANIDESEMLAIASIGELPETISWIVSIFHRFIKVIALFKAKRIRLTLRRLTAKKKADAILNFWMELRYAVRPLMFEYSQALNVLRDNAKPERRTARGYHAVENVLSESSQLAYFDGGPNHITVDTKTTRFSSYRAGVLYDIGIADDVDKWMAVLGVDQPLESLWELTRLSFAIDWFINIGDLLASWTPNSNLTARSSWITEEHTFLTSVTQSDLTLYSTGSNYTFDINAQYGWERVERRLKVRTPCPTRPLFPSVKINLNMAKLVDLVAIARNIYRAMI